MPVTISYDMTVSDTNHRTYVRSMLERFGWKRLGGSVFRYSGRLDPNSGEIYEDWLNDVAPALMFLRSYAIRKNITLNFLTLDANSVARIDHSDPAQRYGVAPQVGAHCAQDTPTNEQSSVKTIQDFIDKAIAASAP